LQSTELTSVQPIKGVTMSKIYLNTGGKDVSFDTNGGASLAFIKSLKEKSVEDLKGMLQDPKLTAAERTAVLNELAKDAWNNADSAEDKKKITDLMNKLKNGSITEAELDELAGLLGMKAEDLNLPKDRKNTPNSEKPNTDPTAPPTLNDDECADDKWKKEMKSKSTAQLKDVLKDKNASADEKKAAMEELASRKSSQYRKEYNNTDANELDDLMKKARAGKLTAGEKKKLAELLGVSEDEIQSTYGNGKEGSGTDHFKNLTNAQLRAIFTSSNMSAARKQAALDEYIARLAFDFRKAGDTTSADDMEALVKKAKAGDLTEAEIEKLGKYLGLTKENLLSIYGPQKNVTNTAPYPEPNPEPKPAPATNPYASKSDAEVAAIASDSNASDREAALEELIGRKLRGTELSPEAKVRLNALIEKAKSGGLNPDEIKELAKILGITENSVVGLYGAQNGTAPTPPKPDSPKPDTTTLSNDNATLQAQVDAMTDAELKAKLKDPNLTSKQRDYIIRELKDRYIAAHPDQADRANKFFNLYMEFKFNRFIGDDANFAKMLGIDKEDLNQPWPPETDKEDIAYYLSKHNNQQLRDMMANQSYSLEFRKAVFNERFFRILNDPANANDREFLQGLYDKWKSGEPLTDWEAEYIAGKMGPGTTAATVKALSR
jgi:DNA-binding transcriptional regulator YdaS (Cro superfamily)/uncharacterized protein YnzC (UPF0291/DUF896 family)